MNSFYVGQKVRIRKDIFVHPDTRHFLGQETTIEGHSLDVFGDHEWHLGLGCWARSGALEPLTDPKAEEFIERIRKIEREPVPMQRRSAIIKKETT